MGMHALLLLLNSLSSLLDISHERYRSCVISGWEIITRRILLEPLVVVVRMLVSTTSLEATSSSASERSLEVSGWFCFIRTSGIIEASATASSSLRSIVKASIMVCSMIVASTSNKGTSTRLLLIPVVIKGSIIQVVILSLWCSILLGTEVIVPLRCRSISRRLEAIDSFGCSLLVKVSILEVSVKSQTTTKTSSTPWVILPSTSWSVECTLAILFLNVIVVVAKFR